MKEIIEVCSTRFVRCLSDCFFIHPSVIFISMCATTPTATTTTYATTNATADATTYATTDATADATADNHWQR